MKERLVGIRGASIEDVIKYANEKNGKEQTREEVVYGMYNATTIDEALKNSGYTDEDIKTIEQEYQNLEQPEEIPENIKNKTYTITYPNGETTQVKGEELNTIIIRTVPKGNGSNKIKINDGNKEVVLQLNTKNYCRDYYEDEYYEYYCSSDPDGYIVKVKDKTLTQYGKILEEIDGIPVASMKETFKDCANLVQAPDIPSGVSQLRECFSGCVNLQGEMTIYSNEKYNFDGVFENAATSGNGLKVIVPDDKIREALSSDTSYDKTKVQFVKSK